MPSALHNLTRLHRSNAISIPDVPGHDVPGHQPVPIDARLLRQGKDGLGGEVVVVHADEPAASQMLGRFRAWCFEQVQDSRVNAAPYRIKVWNVQPLLVNLLPQVLHVFTQRRMVWRLKQLPPVFQVLGLGKLPRLLRIGNEGRGRHASAYVAPALSTDHFAHKSSHKRRRPGGRLDLFKKVYIHPLSNSAVGRPEVALLYFRSGLKCWGNITALASAHVN